MDIEEVAVAFPSSNQFGTALARRVAALPSGLSIYQFDTGHSINTLKLRKPEEGETFHAIRLVAGEEQSAEQKATVEQQLADTQKKISDASEKIAALLSKLHSAGVQNRSLSKQLNEIERLRMDISELEEKEHQIKCDQIFPVREVKATELAAAIDSGELGGRLENALLVSSGKAVLAIRSGEKWLQIKDLVEASAGIIREANLNLTGHSNGLSLTCEVKPLLPFGDHGFSLVAASMLELESQGSGSIEERLISLERTPFQVSSDNPSISRQIEWNGKTSNVWIRVYSNKEPDKPILDEIIRVSYDQNFFARWAKPPSPLIKIPDPKPNVPEDLVSEKVIADAKGEILDIVAAGNGSCVMVQTDAAPYWAAFDLSTGKWMPVKWKATENTLVAAQAGKLYLLDRTTKVLEIRDFSSGERVGLQILSYEGNAVSFAAPLTNPDKPIIVATNKGAYLFDPLRFEPVATGMALDQYFDAASENAKYTYIDSATLRLRVSDDGILYSLRGMSMSGNNEHRRRIGVTTALDASSIAVATYNDTGNLALRGRARVENFPDHGGGGWLLNHQRTSSYFPGRAGSINFVDVGTKQTIAELADLPTLPSALKTDPGGLADDRGCYFDSKAGVMLVPDGAALHFFKLKLPQLPTSIPAIVMPGEKVAIPLSPGTGHSLTSSAGGSSAIEGQVMHWTAPLSQSQTSVNLKLQWQGELGSPMDAQYQTTVLPGVGLAEAVSPDGKKRLPLQLRGLLPSAVRGLHGLAGSGHIVIAKYFDKVGVYNLSSCELLYQLKVEAQKVLGDADHLYLVEPGKKITSLEIASGRVIAEKNLSADISNIATGHASRLPLFALEKQGGNTMLLMLDRNTLDSRLMELNDELRRRFFTSNLVSNPSGSAMWTKSVAIYRDGKAITMRTFPPEKCHKIMNAAPDATGKVVVDQHSVYDISGGSPVATRVPGTEDDRWIVGLDLSGQYLMVAPRFSSSDPSQISVRSVKAPGKELFRIQATSPILNGFPWMISETGTLLCEQQLGGAEKYFVYDLNIPSIYAELSR